MLYIAYFLNYIFFLPDYLMVGHFLTVFCWFQPPKIKAFINKVIQCPLQDIAIPLSGFRWEYSKVVASYFSV